MKNKLLLFPLIIFLLILSTFFYLLLLERNPSELPSNLLNKNVVITSTHGSIITILSGVNNRQSVIRINKGKLENLGIQNGRGLVGGGVWAGGTALIKNCFIKSIKFTLMQYAIYLKK